MAIFRLWFVVLEDTFYDPGSGAPTALLSFMDYVPQAKKNEETNHLLKRLNEDVNKKKFRGNIL